MQKAHAKLFAGAAFALNKDRNIGLRNPLQLFRTACMAAVFPKIMSSGGRLSEAADSAW